MTEMAEILIERAASIVNPWRIGDYLIGDVECALVTDQGNIYVGVWLDLPSDIGFCAAASAIAAMVTAGEQRIAQIVAVWKDENGVL
jgi:cytidine deaminase